MKHNIYCNKSSITDIVTGFDKEHWVEKHFRGLCFGLTSDNELNLINFYFGILYSTSTSAMNVV